MKTNVAMRAPTTIPARAAKIILRRRVLPMLIAGCFGSGAALANPVGPQVVNGQASFSNQGNVLSITNTPGAIINWQSFSINPGELTRFIQQNPNSAVLNRILGQDPSVILGALQSNGRVFLVNPNGILFGQGAQIDVNGLVASTLAISNEDFLNGKLNFKAGEQAGKLQNQGSITTPSGGQVYLIAPQVENSGIITSPQGEVLLAAGHTVQLVDSANPELHVVLSAPEHEALNLGQIIAQGGKAGIYGALIKQRGIVSANSAVVGENGKIVFKASKETLLEAGSVTSATGGGKGGEIQVLGEHVGLTGDAKVDASGRQGGGTVLVGGDYQGKNPLIKNASATYVGSEATLKADALDSGDGGKIIVWADEATRFYGSLSARGGSTGGNGGFAETSGKQALAFHGHADLSAPRGKAGTLLLDPDSVTIGSGSTDVTGTPNFDTTINGGSLVDAAELTSLLEAGNNVSVKATGDITVNQSVAWTTNRSLTLDAAGNMAVNQPLTASGANAAVWLAAGGDITQAAAITVPTLHATSISGAVTLNGSNTVGTFHGSAGTNLSFTNSGTNLTVAAASAGDSITINNSQSIILNSMTAANDVSVTANGTGTVVVAGAITSTSGTISIDAGNNLTLNATLSAGNAVTLTAGYDANLGAIDATLGDIYVSAGHDLTASGTVHSANGQVSLNATNNLTTSGAISAASHVSLDASNGDLTVGAAINVTDSGASANLSAGTSVAINDSITTNNGDVYISAPSVSLSGTGTVIDAGNAWVTIDSSSNGSISIGSGTQIKTNGGEVRLSADNMALDGTIQAGNGEVTLMPYDEVRDIELIGEGASKTGSKLELKQSELNNITAGTLNIYAGGGTTTTVSAPMALSNIANLYIDSGSIIVNQPLSMGMSDATVELNGSAIAVGANGGISTVGSNSLIRLSADSLNLQGATGSINAGAGTTEVAPHSSTTIEIGSSAADDNGVLRLTNSELNTFGGSGNVVIGSQVHEWYGDLSTAGNIDLAGSQLTGTLWLMTGGTLTIGHGIKSAGDVRLSGSHINLDNGLIDAGTKRVTFSSNGTADLGSSTDASSSGIELSAAELNHVTAGTIDVQANSAVTISAPIAPANASTLSLSGASVAQNANASVSVANLAVKTEGDVTLDGAINSVGKVAAVVGNNNASSFYLKNGIALDVGTVDKLSGISIYGGTGNYNYAAPENVIALQVSGGNLTQSAGALLMGKAVYAEGASVLLTNSNPTGVIAGKATGGSTGVFNYASVNGISIDTVYGQAGIDNSGTSAATGIDLTGASVSQSTAVSTATGLALHTTGTVAMGGITNSVGALSATTPTSLAFKNYGALTVGIGGTGISTSNGLVDLQSVSGGINVASQIDAGTGTVSMSAPGMIYGGTVKGGTLSLSLGGGAKLTTQVSALAVANTGLNSPIEISNTGALTIYDVLQSNPSSAGHIVIDNVGATTVAANHSVSTNSGSISITAHSPLTIDGTVSSNSGTIALEAGSSGSTADKLTISAGATVNTTGSISLKAGDTIAVSGTVGPQATQQANQNVPKGPTLTECIAIPTLAGCSTVLPSLDQCTASPTTLGCSAVLPTLATCTAAPTTPGCTVVLPTLAQCTTAPTTAGCTAVLPTLTQCTTTPTTEGCSAVLPTLALCTTTPTTDGCSAVLPTLAVCTSTPATPGCTAVLPTLATCTTAPTTAGCTAVLPTLAQCTATPTADGCTAVLPTLAQCTTAPTTPGCTVVLPTLAQCTTAPTTAGCTAVLPTLAQCMTAPTTAGCTAVLPTLAQCTTAPTTAGCAAVLPTLAECTTAPATSGCAAVLPTTAQCTTAPTTPGCSTVLPSLTQCVATPTAEGCSAVLPTLAQCTATPTLAGCTAVLPLASVCEISPASPGCVTTPPTQQEAPSTAAVTKVLSSTITTLINTTTNLLPVNNVPANGMTGAAPGQPAPSGNGTPPGQKPDGKKDEKKDASGPKDDGVKKNEPAKKLYCN